MAPHSHPNVQLIANLATHLLCGAVAAVATGGSPFGCDLLELSPRLAFGRPVNDLYF